jgi:hypothetical protein
MPAEIKKLEENKKTVVGFYQKALFEGDVEMAIRLYGGKAYTQHTPFAADGFEGLRNYVTKHPTWEPAQKQLFMGNDFSLSHPCRPNGLQKCFKIGFWASHQTVP